MLRKKSVLAMLALVMCVAMLFVGCQPTTPGDSNSPPPTGADTGTDGGDGNVPLEGQDIMVCVGPDPEYMDPAFNSSVDGSIMLNNAFSGIYGYSTDESGKIVVVADCASEIVTPTEVDGGKYQYVITLKDGLKWSDGEPMKASDFTYAWNRAVDPATAADYQYIFDVIDGYSETEPALNIVADDAANTITIVTKAYCSYFDQLLAFPTYYPVRQDIVEAGPDTWATVAETYITNGAFRMKEWTPGSSIVFEKNEHYWDAANVKLNTLTFALSDDDDANFANYENDTYALIYNVAISQIPTLKETRLDKDFFIGDYIGTYFLEFNVEASLKPGLTSADDSAAAWQDWTPEQNAEVRKALGLLIDRNYIVEEVTQSGELPANGFVPKGVDDGTGAEFRSKAGEWYSVDAAEYDANCEQAVEILKKYYEFDEASGKFTNIPIFEYSINTNSRNIAICEAVQNMWADYGIQTSVDQRTWSVIQTALTNGDFTMSRLGWIADYNDPINFLEIYVSVSGNNHPRLGKEGPVGAAAIYGANKDKTWADAYDALVAQIKATSDMQERATLMYQVEEALKDTSTIVPIFFYTNPYLAKETLKDYIYSPLGWVSFKHAYVG